MVVSRTPGWSQSVAVLALGASVLGGCKSKGPPHAVVWHLTEVDEVTIDERALYWRAGTSLMRADKDGKSPKAIGQGEITRMAVDQSGVYFTSEQAGTLSSLPVAGGAATTLATKLGKPAALAMDILSVYVANRDTTGSILKIPKGGGKPVVLADGQAEPQAIAVDATHVYWATSSGQVASVKKTGGPTHKIDSDTGVFADLVVDDKNVYWANVFGEGITIFKKLKDGRGQKKEMTTLAGTKPRLCVVGSGLYVSASHLNRDQVLKIPIAGGGAVEVVSQAGEARGLAVDRADAFVGVKDGEGAILKVPVPRP